MEAGVDTRRFARRHQRQEDQAGAAGNERVGAERPQSSVAAEKNCAEQCGGGDREEGDRRRQAVQALTEDLRRGATRFAGEQPGADTADAVERDEYGDEQRQAGAIGEAEQRGAKGRGEADMHAAGRHETAIAHEGLGGAAAFAEFADVLAEMVKTWTQLASDDDRRRPENGRDNPAEEAGADHRRCRAGSAE